MSHSISSQTPISQLSAYAMPLGRVLIAVIFIMAGLGKFMDPASSAGYMSAFGVPTLLLWPAAVLELLGGVFIFVGSQTRITALLLAGFTVLAALIFHTDFANQVETIMFMKNLAITGGLLFLIAHGPGALSLDKR